MKLPRQLIAVPILAIVFVGGYAIQRSRDRSRSVLSGTFESQPALLSARVAGRVKSILVKEGDSVTSNQILARLDAGPDVQDTKELETEVSGAEQAYMEAHLSRQEQVAVQSAVVQELEAAYDKAKNGARPEEIEAARASLRGLETKLAEAIHGARPEEIAQAKAALGAAEANLEKAQRGGSVSERRRAQADIDAAKATEAQAKLAFDRREVLYSEGAISAENRDNAKTDYDVAVSKRKAAEQTMAELNTRPEDIAFAEQQVAQSRDQVRLLLAGTRPEEIAAARAARDQSAANLRLLLRGTRPEDIAAAEAKLSQAKATLGALTVGSRNQAVEEARLKVAEAKQRARASNDKTIESTLRAPRAGNVERVLVADGELLSPGKPAFRVSYPDDVYLRVYIPEQNLSQVRVGVAAKVEVDGLGQSVDCLVESVATEGEFTPANLQTPEERGRQVFAVRLRPRTPDPRLKPGMSASVKTIGDWTP